jgi:hypothetical protein
MPEPIFIKLGMYIMVPESMSTASLISASHLSVCLYVANQRLGKNGNEYTRNNRRMLGRVVFYAVRIKHNSRQNQIIFITLVTV